MPSQRSTTHARISRTTVLLIVWMVVLLAVGLLGSYEVYRGVREYVAGMDSVGPFQPNPTRKPDATPLPTDIFIPDWQGTERVTLLVMGIDQRTYEEGPWRTDTMILVTVDPATKSTAMLSIPRDLWVPIPGFQESRINNAHFYGDAFKYPGGGPALAKKTVQQNFGLPVQYYVRINFSAFEKLVDLIGGIDVRVERTIDDPEYPAENNPGYDPFHMDAGLQHMDGKTALKYARSRHDDPLGDFGRSRRQQQVILAIRDKVMQINALPKLLPRAGEIASTLGEAVQTDLSLQQVIQLAKLGTQMDRSRIKSVFIDQTVTLPFTTPDNDQVLVPLRDEIRKLVRDQFLAAPPPLNAQGTPVPVEAPANIVVQNGTPQVGLAGQTANALKARGFNVVQYGNTDDNRSDYAQTEIIVYTGRTAAAQALAEALQVPQSAIQTASSPGGNFDIRVILGADYRLISAPVSVAPSLTVTR
jgi:LCP family protein required for cell wall assembly